MSGIAQIYIALSPLSRMERGLMGGIAQICICS